MKNSKITKLKAERAKQFRLTKQQHDNELVEAVKSLYELINGKDTIEVHDRTREVEVKYNWDQLITQIKEIRPIVNIENDLTALEEAIQKIKLFDEVKVTNLDSLIKAIELNKPIIKVEHKDIDVKPIVKAIVEVQQRIQEQSIGVQEASSYKPVRRVVRQGNRLIFDDTIGSGSRGGGGSGVTSFLLNGVQTEVSPQHPLPATIEGDVTITGDVIVDDVGLENVTGTKINPATEEKQTTGNTSLSNIDTNLGAKADAVATTDTGTFSLVALIKRVNQWLTTANGYLQSLVVGQSDKSQFTKLTDGTDTALITGAGEQNVLATPQPGVDIGDVTVNNASGASAVNVQDGGNSITVDGTFWQATQPVSVAATVATLETRPSSASVNAVTMTGSSVTLAASNASRRGLMVSNNSGVDVYIKFGTSASSTSHTIKLANTGYYEIPEPVYTGIVTGIGASGDVLVTETT